jgi:hypothetical protein
MEEFAKSKKESPDTTSNSRHSESEIVELPQPSIEIMDTPEDANDPNVKYLKGINKYNIVVFSQYYFVPHLVFTISLMSRKVSTKNTLGQI